MIAAGFTQPELRAGLLLRLGLLVAFALSSGGCQVQLSIAGDPATLGRVAPDAPRAVPVENDEPTYDPEPLPKALWNEGGHEGDARAAGEFPGGLLAEPHRKIPDVDAGGYAGDPRWSLFRRAWPRRVQAAFDRLAVVTGLEFVKSSRPRVILRPFDDERRTHELRAEILEGRRRVVLHVNVEPLIARVHDADRILLRALAEAAFQDAALRHGPVPRWFVELAGLVAAGDSSARLAGLARRAHDGEAGALRVDPKDATAAEATAHAALLLLASRGEPAAVRRAILFVADGDPAGDVMGRQGREVDGDWVAPARLALGERLAELDREPWLLLDRARAAVLEMGRAGLDATVPEAPPPEVADELVVMQAEAAAQEGDFTRARELLRTLSADAPARLQDPAGALRLRIDVESRAGGDTRTARRLAQQLDRDFPQSKARKEFQAAHPLLGMEEDPERWLRRMRTRIAAGGTDDLEIGTLRRYARMLLMDHRAGAAERLLAGLGERGQAPEFEAVRETADDAQADPTGAALDRGAARVAAWKRDRTDEHARDVRETGRAARPALLALLEEPSLPMRSAAVRMLAETLDETDAVASVRALWRGAPARIGRDLTALGAAVSYPALEVVLEPEGLSEAEAQALTKAWDRLTFGLSRRWLSSHPRFLQDVRADEFGVRREALAMLGREGPREATPAIVAYGLGDSAALMRKEAATLAGVAGFRALARRALEDRAWIVREEAVHALTRLEGRDAVPALVRIVREDRAVDVRAAAALGLVRTAPDDDRAIDALLASQVAEESRLRDAIGARLAELAPEPVVRGMIRGWRRALGRQEPSRGYLFRTSLLFGRLTKRSLGYYPGATKAELRTMIGTMEAWLRSRGPQDGAAPDTRTPARRAR